MRRSKLITCIYNNLQKLNACNNVLLHTFTTHVPVALHVADGDIHVTVM